MYIRSGKSESDGKFTVNDGHIISTGFYYSFDINIHGNNGTKSCNGSASHELGYFPLMSFKFEESDSLNIEGSIFKREK